jgi:hypothetical protein
MAGPSSLFSLISAEMRGECCAASRATMNYLRTVAPTKRPTAPSVVCADVRPSM